jgi:hypothetical protein
MLRLPAATAVFFLSLDVRANLIFPRRAGDTGKTEIVL